MQQNNTQINDLSALTGINVQGENSQQVNQVAEESNVTNNSMEMNQLNTNQTSVQESLVIENQNVSVEPSISEISTNNSLINNDKNITDSIITSSTVNQDNINPIENQSIQRLDNVISNTQSNSIAERFQSSTGNVGSELTQTNIVGEVQNVQSVFDSVPSEVQIPQFDSSIQVTGNESNNASEILGQNVNEIATNLSMGKVENNLNTNNVPEIIALPKIESNVLNNIDNQTKIGIMNSGVSLKNVKSFSFVRLFIWVIILLLGLVSLLLGLYLAEVIQFPFLDPIFK